jgi:hypothetical protein
MAAMRAAMAERGRDPSRAMTYLEIEMACVFF